MIDLLIAFDHKFRVFHTEELSILSRPLSNPDPGSAHAYPQNSHVHFAVFVFKTLYI